MNSTRGSSLCLLVSDQTLQLMNGGANAQQLCAEASVRRKVGLAERLICPLSFRCSAQYDAICHVCDCFVRADWAGIALEPWS